MSDPNWNVVATADEEGEIQERFVYDAFGRVHGLTSDWNRTFTGQVLDHETGLMLYRMRFYHVDLGRFVSTDPLSYYSQEINLYRYVVNSTLNYLDPEGEHIVLSVCRTAFQRVWPGVIRLVKICSKSKKKGETKTGTETTPKPKVPTGPVQPPPPPIGDDCDPPSCKKEYPHLPSCSNKQYTIDEADSQKAIEQFLQDFRKRIGPVRDGKIADSTSDDCHGGKHVNLYHPSGGFVGTVICCPCCEETPYEAIPSTGCTIN